jgi:hypothetical protein
MTRTLTVLLPLMYVRSIEICAVDQQMHTDKLRLSCLTTYFGRNSVISRVQQSVIMCKYNLLILQWLSDAVYVFYQCFVEEP